MAHELCPKTTRIVTPTHSSLHFLLRIIRRWAWDTWNEGVLYGGTKQPKACDVKEGGKFDNAKDNIQCPARLGFTPSRKAEIPIISYRAIPALGQRSEVSIDSRAGVGCIRVVVIEINLRHDMSLDCENKADVPIWMRLAWLGAQMTLP